MSSSLPGSIDKTQDLNLDLDLDLNSTDAQSIHSRTSSMHEIFSWATVKTEITPTPMGNLIYDEESEDVFAPNERTAEVSAYKCFFLFNDGDDDDDADDDDDGDGDDDDGDHDDGDDDNGDDDGDDGDDGDDDDVGAGQGPCISSWSPKKRLR